MYMHSSASATQDAMNAPVTMGSSHVVTATARSSPVAAASSVSCAHFASSLSFLSESPLSRLPSPASRLLTIVHTPSVHSATGTRYCGCSTATQNTSCSDIAARVLRQDTPSSTNSITGRNGLAAAAMRANASCPGCSEKMASSALVTFVGLTDRRFAACAAVSGASPRDAMCVAE